MARLSHSSSTRGLPVPATSGSTSKPTPTGVEAPSESPSTSTSTAVPSPIPLASFLRRDSNPEFDFDSHAQHAQHDAQTVPDDPSLLPNGNRSLSSIGLQSFWTGFTLAACLFLTPYLSLSLKYSLWRLPAFFACLSLFHFLEYYTTARFNPPAARASSFLIFSNGRQYAIAHSCATLEILVSSLLPTYQQSFVWRPWTVILGALLVIVGQGVRSFAMAQAGTNFNHTPARERKAGHVLVTQGVYSLLRHPSYFGFFWWALGTQLLVGNKVCLMGFALALWKFFDNRIRGEQFPLAAPASFHHTALHLKILTCLCCSGGKDSRPILWEHRHGALLLFPSLYPEIQKSTCDEPAVDTSLEAEVQATYGNIRNSENDPEAVTLDIRRRQWVGPLQQCHISLLFLSVTMKVAVALSER
nr:protein-s-isoprenylcysteine o-methyltransferase [Quercus suber]